MLLVEVGVAEHEVAAAFHEQLLRQYHLLAPFAVEEALEAHPRFVRVAAAEEVLDDVVCVGKQATPSATAHLQPQVGLTMVRLAAHRGLLWMMSSIESGYGGLLSITLL